MKLRYGIDTSILVRLLTGDPAKDYEMTVQALEQLLKQHPASAVFASNQVIGEAYIAVQHHYKVSKAEARAALLAVLSSGLVAPLDGMAVLNAIRSTEGCGLLDRLIESDYQTRGLTTLTHDRKMSTLEGVMRL